MAGEISAALVANLEESGATFTVAFEGVSDTTLSDMTPREVILGESLLTPGLQTSITFDSYTHTLGKDFDEFRNSTVNINIQAPLLAAYGMQSELEVLQKVYRIDNRKPINNNTQRLTLRACDQSQLDDPKTLVSKSYKCTTPDSVVADVLGTCLGVQRASIETSGYPRDYVADNIHPFQVIQQQTNYAVAAGSDPSFLHYMTYEDLGTHHFRSLFALTKEDPVMTFAFNEIGTHADPFSILNYSFPCDFDILSDILNGIDEYGRNINSLILLNPLDKSFSFFNQEFNLFGCGIGSGVIKTAISNQTTAQRQDMCPDYSKDYMQFRQSRMSLLEKDKIALRLIVPFNPMLNAGKIIDVQLNSKEAYPSSVLNYGSGQYMILHMFHHIHAGGLATTTMDCVSKTAGNRGAIIL